MKFDLHKLGTLAMVAILLASAGSATAALTYDDETTNTTTTSDLVGGETVENLDATNESKRIEVISGNASSSSLSNPEEALTLKLTVNDAENDDDGHTFYVNDSASWVVEDATNGHYSINLTHAAMFDEMPRNVNENVTVDVTAVFNESEDDEEKSTITVHAQNDDTRAVDVITDDDVDDENDVDLVNETRTLRADLDYASVESDEKIAENTSRVSLVFENDSVAEKYTTAYDVGDFDDGDYIYSMTSHSNGVPIMVFDSEKGETTEAGWFTGGFGEDDTYGVFQLNGGEHGDTATLDVYPGEDDLDEDELEIESAGNKSLGFWTNLKHFGTDAAQASGIGVAPN